MTIKQQILLLTEEEEINTPEKLITAINNGRVSGVKPNSKVNASEIINGLKDIPSIYRNAAIKLATKHITKGIKLIPDAYLAYFLHRNKQEAKTKYKQLFTDFEEGKVDNSKFEKQVLDIFKDKVTGKEDAEKLFEDSIWLMVKPKTYAASCKYGANTKWCTTGNKSFFDKYTKKSTGLLIIINKKTNEKYQTDSDSNNFFDATDKTPNNLEEVYNSLPEQIKAIMKKHGINIWNKLFIDYAEKGNLKKVKEMLGKGADIHAKNDAALRLASGYGHIEVVKLLLNKGADIHANNDYALRWASGHGHIEVVKLLLDKGADIHADDDFALRGASTNGYIEVVKLLLDKGADIHADDDFALRSASEKGHAEVVKLLLDNGANIHADDDYALRLASYYGHKEVVKLLKQYMKKGK